MVSDRNVCMIQWTPHNHDLQSRKYAIAYFNASIYVTEFEAYKSKAQLSIRPKVVANIRHLK